jgi:choline dehydrogenase
MDVYLTAATIPVSYNSSDRPDKAALAGLQYIATRTGPITASVCEAGMFVRSTRTLLPPTSRCTHCPRT